MKHQLLLTEFRDELVKLSLEVKSSVAQSLLDINTICENVFCDLLKELYSLPNLRNLNAEEEKNYPAIDLADDVARVAIQVTSTADLAKVKDTLKTFLKHKLNTRYDRLVVYVLTEKQGSYSQPAIDKVLERQFEFTAKNDIWDYLDVQTKAASVSPSILEKAFSVLRSYMRGAAVGLAEEDFDPPASPPESLALNLLEAYFPSTLYIANLLPEVSAVRGRINRKSVRAALAEHELVPPSDFEVRASQLLTFHNLENRENPFTKVIDSGTVTPIEPREFAAIDGDHERTFKSLLRLLLQQQLYQHNVEWKYDVGLFVFCPNKIEDDVRTENWSGKRTSTRKVFERKMNKKDPSKVFSVKHLAFAPQFLCLNDGWYLSITPNWYFSFGENFGCSAFSDQQLSGIKRLEKNRSVYNQFRFWAAWLTRCDEDDLFRKHSQTVPALTFGNEMTISGTPYLNENLWVPVEEQDTDDVHPNVQRSFDAL